MLAIDIFILALLVVTAVAVARIRNLWAAVMFTGIYSFLGASWMLILDAPDVAFTEAAVGAGISTVLMLSTLALTGKEEKPTTPFPVWQLLVVLVTGATLAYGTLDMPHFGDPEAPVQTYPDPSFVERSIVDMSHASESDHGGHSDEHGDSETHLSQADSESSDHEHEEHGVHAEIPNVVTVVLASYRGYDTLGETTVIFTAGIAVLLILRRPRTRLEDAE